MIHKTINTIGFLLCCLIAAKSQSISYSHYLAVINDTDIYNCSYEEIIYKNYQKFEKKRGGNLLASKSYKERRLTYKKNIVGSDVEEHYYTYKLSLLDTEYCYINKKPVYKICYYYNGNSLEYCIQYTKDRTNRINFAYEDGTNRIKKEDLFISKWHYLTKKYIYLGDNNVFEEIELVSDTTGGFDKWDTLSVKIKNTALSFELIYSDEPNYKSINYTKLGENNKVKYMFTNVIDNSTPFFSEYSETNYNTSGNIISVSKIFSGDKNPEIVSLIREDINVPRMPEFKLD
jgi:hypothetical protein